MPTEIESIIEKARSLSLAERQRLMAELIAAEDAEKAVDAGLLATARRRAAEVGAGTAKLVAGEDVFRKVRERHGVEL